MRFSEPEETVLVICLNHQLLQAQVMYIEFVLYSLFLFNFFFLRVVQKRNARYQ